MSISRAAARAALAAYLIGSAAMLVGPAMAGPVRTEIQPLRCPKLAIRHGVGADLRTFTQVRDLCANPAS